MIRGGSGAYPYHEGHHLIVALHEFIYTDESGTHSGSVYCIVAGYRGSPRQWKKFSQEWRMVLTQFNIDAFHSNVFVNRKKITNPDKNPYLRWSDKKAQDFHEALLDVFRKRRLYPVGTSVDVHAFRACSHAEQCILAGYETKPTNRQGQKPAPYHLAFRFMVVDAVSGIDPTTEIHFICSDQRQYRQRALDGYGMAKRTWEHSARSQLKGIGFECPQDFPGLQAADLLAYHWYNYSTRGRSRMNTESVTAMNVLTRGRPVMPLVDSASIERIFTELEISPADRERLRGSAERPSDD